MIEEKSVDAFGMEDVVARELANLCLVGLEVVHADGTGRL